MKIQMGGNIMRKELSLGALISTVYEQFMSLYGDPDAASVATAAVINDMLTDQPSTRRQEQAA